MSFKSTTAFNYCQACCINVGLIHTKVLATCCGKAAVVLTQYKRERKRDDRKQHQQQQYLKSNRIVVTLFYMQLICV